MGGAGGEVGGGGEGEEIDLPNIPEQPENPDLEQEDLPMNAGGLLTHTHTQSHTLHICLQLLGNMKNVKAAVCQLYTSYHSLACNSV